MNAPLKTATPTLCMTNMKHPHLHLRDLQGYGQLVVDAALGVTDIVEAMHHTILSLPMPLGQVGIKPAAGTQGAVSYTHLTLPTKRIV